MSSKKTNKDITDIADQEVLNNILCIDIDLEEYGYSEFDTVFWAEDIERIYVVMPPAANFSWFYHNYQKKMEQKDKSVRTFYCVDNGSIYSSLENYIKER